MEMTNSQSAASTSKKGVTISNKPASKNWKALQQKLGKQKSPVITSPLPRKRKRSTNYGSAKLVVPASAVKIKSLDSDAHPSSSSGIVDKMMQALDRGSKSSASSKSSALHEPSVKVASEPEVKSNDTHHLRKMVIGKLQYTKEESKPGKYLAVDCEMVGLGPKGSRDSLARVSIVNFWGAPILDVYVKQEEVVTDYRTKYSGIQPSDLTGPRAKDFDKVQTIVSELLKDRVLVGHAVYNDLRALGITHSAVYTRDTQHCPELRRKYSARMGLKRIVMRELQLNIQENGHSSLEDARATMAIYRLYKANWDKPHVPPVADDTLPATTPSEPSFATLSATVDPVGPVQFPSSGLALHVDMPTPSSKATAPSSAPKSKARPTTTPTRRARAGTSSKIKNAKTAGKISSGLTVVVRRKGGQKEVKSHVKPKITRGLAGASNGKGSASTENSGGDWWSTLG